MAGEATAYLVEGFTPNPYFGRLDGMITEENAELLQAISDLAQEHMGDGLFMDALDDQFLEHALEVFGDQLDDMLETFVNTPEELPSMPSAPNPQCVYSRVCHTTSVLDIGSGEGKKAESAKIKDLVLSDIAPNERPISRKYLQLDCQDLGQLSKAVSLGIQSDRVLTSNMSLTQARYVHHVLGYDGIHLVPDVEYLKATGARVLEDGRIQARFRNKVYQDYDHGFTGYHITAGYLGICGFKNRRHYIELSKNKYKLKPPDLPQIMDSPFNLDSESTPKYDGLQLTFFLDANGGGWVFDRAGNARKVLHDFHFAVVFMTEYINHKNIDYYVLLRNIKYAGFVPWHCLPILQQFCDRVDIDISGSRLMAPGDSRLSHLPADGIIMRRAEVDYRIKLAHTFDFDSTAWHRVVVGMEALMLGFSIDSLPGTAIYEYSCHNDAGVFKFVRGRLRNDKVNVTSFEAVKFFLRL